MSARTRQSQLPGMEAEDTSPRSTGPTDPLRGGADPGSENSAEGGTSTDLATPPPTKPMPTKPVIESDDAPSDRADWTLCAVDAHSLIFQVYHAMAGSDLSSPQGEPVGAVYGFTRDLLQLVERLKPTALICAFDLSGPTFRHELYEAYKAERGAMPDELAAQIPKIREVVSALGIPILERPSFEADDVLATVARLCDEAEVRCLVVSGDKDCRQLITDRVSVYNIRKDQVYDSAALFGDWGIAPEQVVDFQALVGDKVDNVPGVPLIGPKLAKELLDEYGTLEEVLGHAEEVSGAKRRQNLIEHRENALLSRKLVELDRNVAITLDWEQAKLGWIDQDRVSELFRQFGFRSLGERVAAIAGPQAIPAVAAPTSAPTDARIVDTEQDLRELVAQMSKQPAISIDTETTNISPRWAELVGYAIAWEPGIGFYVPVRAPAGDRVVDPMVAAELLRPVLEDPSIAKIGQNLKYDAVVLRSAGIRLQGIALDTMLASYLLDAGERSHNLDHLARTYLDHETTKIDALIGSGKKQKRMDEVPVADVGPYAAEDADIPLRLMPLLQARLDREGLAELNDAVETPLIEVLAEMEHLGVCVDVDRLAELSREYTIRLHRLEEEIEELAGRPLNIASPKQLAQLLFTDLGLPVIKKTKTGPSTDASVLDELAPLHPLPAKIVEYRQYAKLLGTYIDALPKLVHPETGRVHAQLNQVVAATGRLSSSSPNLQNIPIRTREGREIRSAFKAGEKGWQLLAADYSQIELRVLAHYSGDETLCRAFANDEDVHQLVASQVHEVAMDDVTPEMRRGAKAVNFGIIYGQSPFGLAKSLGIPKEEAALFIERYFERYPGVLQFMVDTLTECRRRGFVTTLLCRKRAVQGVRPTPDGLREEKTGALRQLNLPERTAVNTVIQGSAADLIKLAMLRVSRRLPESGLAARLLLQIHDELLFETPAEEASQLATLAREEMGGAMQLDVPLKVDVKAGMTWADCEALA